MVSIEYPFNVQDQTNAQPSPLLSSNFSFTVHGSLSDLVTCPIDINARSSTEKHPPERPLRPRAIGDMDPASQHQADADSEHLRDDSEDSGLSSPLSKPDSLLAAHLKSQISPQQSRGRAATVRSYQSSSSDLSSEVAPEIVVWTEDMDLDSDELSDASSLSDMSDMPMSDVEEDGDDQENNDQDDDEQEDDDHQGDVQDDEGQEDETLLASHLHDGAVGSFASSLSVLTDLSDISSIPSSVSSKATTPVDTEVPESHPSEEPTAAIPSPMPQSTTLSQASPPLSPPPQESPPLSPPPPQSPQSPRSSQSPQSAQSPPLQKSQQAELKEQLPLQRPQLQQQSSSYHNEIDRLAFNIRPKSSIPTDIPLRQYASECVWAAESSRLNPYALHPEEYHIFRHHISHAQVTTYLNIRNGILRLWMAEPWKAVTRQAAIGCANARWFDAANVCYDWLVRHGYINFGCVKFDEPAKLEAEQSPRPKKRKTVAVIGAGISGLGCARQLEGLFHQHASQFRDRGEEPPKVVVLEGRSRVGGRVYSREFKTAKATPPKGFEGKRHTAEMGGMIITGFDRGNPINILVRGQLGMPYHALTADTTIYDSGGKPVDVVRDQLVEKLYNDCLDRVSEFKHKTQPSKLIGGNRDLIDEGRDAPGDGTKTIMQAEEAAAALPHAPPVSQQNVPKQVNMVPVSSDKLTGRVHTQPGVPATLKASEKAKMMGWSVKPGSSEDDNIDLVEATTQEDATLGSVLDHAISQYKRIVDMTSQDHRLINWHIANLEYSNATTLHKLSLPLWDIDAGNEWEGKHTMVVGGYQSVARGLVHCPSSLDVRTRHAVQKIQYNAADAEGSAVIECEDGSTIEADSVVCTIPLGVLKQNSVVFDPPLPSWKQDAVGRLGFGILNKVVLVYDEVFWDPDRHIFGVLRDAPNRHSTAQKDYATNRGRFFQWFNVSNTTGLPCLIALMAGDAGFETEHSSNDMLITEATNILRSVFGNDVPHPVEAVITRWGSDRFARGSYSSAAPGMMPDDYDVMARPVGNLFFAGEHTIGTHPATVHGAYLSGLRAASEILESMLGRIEVPTPLVLPKDSLLLHKRTQSAMDPRQARLEAYELEVWDHVRSTIGERPVRPSKAASNAYLLYSKAIFSEARRRCEAIRKPGKNKSLPNEVRVMTSKMWKEAAPEDRKPFEDQAAENKKIYDEAISKHAELVGKWDLDAAALRAAYERDHPISDNEESPSTADAEMQQKNRRTRPFSYAE